MEKVMKASAVIDELLLQITAQVIWVARRDAEQQDRRTLG